MIVRAMRKKKIIRCLQRIYLIRRLSDKGEKNMIEGKEERGIVYQSSQRN